MVLDLRGFSFFFAAALPVALAACAGGPDFTSPAAPATQKYDMSGMPAPTVAAAEGSAATGLAAQSFAPAADIPAQWWELFHSSGLNKLIDESLRRNPDLAAAQASLRVAQENAAAESGALFPTVNGSFSSTRQKTSGASFGGSFPGSVYTLHNATLSLSYGLDVFGGTRRAIESLDAQAEYQRFEAEATYVSLTANVVTAAIREASLRGQIAATEKIIQQDQDALNVLQAQFQLGGTSKVAVLSQQTVLAQAMVNLPPLRKQLAQTRHQLAVLTGHTPDDEPPVAFDLASIDLPAALPVSLPSQLVAQRPDIQAAAANLHAASAEIGVAEANRLPQITLSADVGSVAANIGKLFGPGSGLWSFGGSAAQTLFDGGTLRHRQRAAEAEYDVAAAQYRKTVLAAFQDVADSLRALQEDAEALKAENEAEAAAAGSLELTRQQFKLGAVTYIELINAEQTEQNSRLSLVQAQAQRYADTAALFQALGGGWWNRPADIAVQPVAMNNTAVAESAAAPVSGDK